jgi:hypothetical protein
MTIVDGTAEVETDAGVAVDLFSVEAADVGLSSFVGLGAGPFLDDATSLLLELAVRGGVFGTDAPATADPDFGIVLATASGFVPVGSSSSIIR